MCQFLLSTIKKKYDICCSVAKSCMTLCSPWTAAVGLSYPSLSPRACSNSCPLSSWCHPTVSSSVAPFSSCSQSFPPSESFPMSWLFFFFFLISWKLITLQYCSGFCHTLTWISHGYTCIPHPNPPSHLPLHPIPLGLPSAPGPSTCLMHPTWAGDLFHPW